MRQRFQLIEVEVNQFVHCLLPIMHLSYANHNKQLPKRHQIQFQRRGYYCKFLQHNHEGENVTKFHRGQLIFWYCWWEIVTKIQPTLNSINMVLLDTLSASPRHKSNFPGKARTLKKFNTCSAHCYKFGDEGDLDTFSFFFRLARPADLSLSTHVFRTLTRLRLPKECSNYRVVVSKNFGLLPCAFPLSVTQSVVLPNRQKTNRMLGGYPDLQITNFFERLPTQRTQSQVRGTRMTRLKCPYNPFAHSTVSQMQ